MNLNLTSAMGSYLSNANSSANILNRLVGDVEKKDIQSNIDRDQFENSNENYNTLSQSLSNSNDGLTMLKKASNSMDKITTLLDKIKDRSADIVIDTNSEEVNLNIKNEIVSMIEDYDKLIIDTNHKGIYPLNNDGEPVKIYIGMDDNNVVDLHLEPLLSKDIGLEKPYVLGNFQNSFRDENGKELSQSMRLNVEIKNRGKVETRSVVLPLDEKQKGDLQLQATILLGIVNQAIQIINRSKGSIDESSKHLEMLTKNVLNLRYNIKEAKASIASADYANESSVFSKLSILSKSGSFILSQANSVSRQKVQSLVA